MMVILFFFSIDNNWCWFYDVIVVLTFIGALPEFLLIFQQINAAIPLCRVNIHRHSVN